MKVGDLVKVKQVLPDALELYPYLGEAGLIVDWDVYHPVVVYSSGTKTMAKGNLEVIS